MQQNNTKRRLAAISFLSNISLDGSYKDTGKTTTLELTKDGIFQSNNNHDNNGPSNGEVNLVQPNPPSLQELEELISSSVIVGNDIIIGDSKSTLHDSIIGLVGKENILNEIAIAKNNSSRVGSISIDEEIFGDLNGATRKRFNTGGSESGIALARRQQQEASLASLLVKKATHFSSSESIETGIIVPSKIINLSATNISECSLEQHEINVVNMCDVNPSKLNIISERLVIVVKKRSPWLIYSILPYQDEKITRLNRPLEKLDGSRRARNTSGSRPVLTPFDPDPLEQLFHKDNEEISYSYLLKPTFSDSTIEDEIVLMKQATSFAMARESSIKSFGGFIANSSTPPEYTGDFREQLQKALGMKYSPHLLDDAEFLAGKHRTLLTFDSYITSVIEYCKPSDLKKELNDKFRDRFPHVQITLSKMRSLKREMRKVARADCSIDLLIVAQAYVYFEKLVLKSYVTKMNRKFCSGACLLLSAKMNDVKGQTLYNLIEVIERSLRVNKKELFKYEFAALISLEFSLHIPTWEILPHYQRLLYES